jgi:hypothetical protein
MDPADFLDGRAGRLLAREILERLVLERAQHCPQAVRALGMTGRCFVVQTGRMRQQYRRHGLQFLFMSLQFPILIAPPQAKRPT